MSVQTAITEVQTAVYALLMPGGSVDSQLATDGVTGVFDFRNVPQNQAFDYVTLGDCYELPKNALGRRGYLLSFGVHIWSRYKGTQGASTILARINQLIDQQPLTLAHHSHIYTMYDRVNMLADPDGLTLHAVARYMIFTQE